MSSVKSNIAVTDICSTLLVHLGEATKYTRTSVKHKRSRGQLHINAVTV